VRESIARLGARGAPRRAIVHAGEELRARRQRVCSLGTGALYAARALEQDHTELRDERDQPTLQPHVLRSGFVNCPTALCSAVWSAIWLGYGRAGLQH